jgi:hypothetical protein
MAGFWNPTPSCSSPGSCSSPPTAPTEIEHHPNAAGTGRHERAAKGTRRSIKAVHARRCGADLGDQTPRGPPLDPGPVSGQPDPRPSMLRSRAPGEAQRGDKRARVAAGEHHRADRGTPRRGCCLPDSVGRSWPDRCGESSRQRGVRCAVVSTWTATGAVAVAVAVAVAAISVVGPPPGGKSLLRRSQMPQPQTTRPGSGHQARCRGHQPGARHDCPRCRLDGASDRCYKMRRHSNDGQSKRSHEAA